VLKCGASAKPCKNYVLTIDDATLGDATLGDALTGEALPGDDPYQSRAYTPDVFFSGEVHGDEAVGPLATTVTAEIMLLAASCSLSYFATPSPPTELSPSCKKWFVSWAFTANDLHWISSLASSRRILLSPMSNPSGFDKVVRTENNIDPNRDFAYDVTDPTRCMRTVAARHINEIFRASLVQVGITYHGGMTAVAYEWGAPSHNTPHTYSPDDAAQRAIGSSLSDVGGKFTTEIKYPSAPMNEIVYPVHGGMEDWAYAGSWDLERAVPGGCNPTDNGGYDRDKTVYNDAVLRAFNILVEASTIKKPVASRLGARSEIFDPNSSYNGHIPRNVRLTLLMIDIVQPYVQFTYVMGSTGKNVQVFDRDVLPGIGRSTTTCKLRNRVEAGVDVSVENPTTFKLSWVAGGGFDVDKTDLFVVKHGWEQVSATCAINFYEVVDDNGVTKLVSKDGTNSIEVIRIKDADKVSEWSGKTRWGVDSGATVPAPTTFEVSISAAALSAYSNSDNEVVFIARAQMDKSWAESHAGVVIDPINTAPQSHVVNARTNKEWVKENAGKKVQGRLDWFSTPLTVVVRPGDVATADVGIARAVSSEDGGSGTDDNTPPVNGNDDAGGDDGGTDDGAGGGHFGNDDIGGVDDGSGGAGTFVTFVLVFGACIGGFVMWKKRRQHRTNAHNGGLRGADGLPSYEMVTNSSTP
jgi:hypothetical protein